MKCFRLALVLLTLVMALILSGCRTAATVPTATPGAQFPLEITDSLGKTAVFQTPPKRIVSLSPAHTEIIFALGAGDRLVGRDAFSDYPAAAKNVPSVGDAFNLNLEKVVSLQPDLVYTTFNLFVADLQRLGITVLYREPPSTVDGVIEETRLFGRLLGEPERAQSLASSMEKRIQTVRQKLSSVQNGPRVFYELDVALYTVAPDTFIGNMLTTLKAQNLAEGTEGFPQLVAETIIQKDPEVVLLADSKEFGNGDETPETARARPGWSAIAAVKNGRVFTVSADLTSRPGPRMVDGLEAMAKLLYPERFR